MLSQRQLINHKRNSCVNLKFFTVKNVATAGALLLDL